MQENIQTWLTYIGLRHLSEFLIEQEVDFDVLETLTEADLKEMGIAALGARKRVLKAIGERNSSTHAQPESGCHRGKGTIVRRRRFLIGTPRSADVTPITPTTLRSVSADSYHKFREKKPGLAAKLLFNPSKILAQRLYSEF